MNFNHIEQRFLKHEWDFDKVSITREGNTGEIKKIIIPEKLSSKGKVRLSFYGPLDPLDIKYIIL